MSQSFGKLDGASLRTLFYEAMAIINSHPLTLKGINYPGSLEPLTPNHLIQMNSETALLPSGDFVRRISTPQSVGAVGGNTSKIFPFDKMARNLVQS